MRFPLVLDLAADGFAVAVICRVLGFTPQAFYKWKKNPVSQRDWDDAHLIDAARDIHADDPTFGYRFIADELGDRGIRAGENRVQRLCSQQRIWSVFARKRGLGRRAGPPVHDDLVAREFAATAPNLLWLTDITEHRTGEGKLYLCAIKDCFSNRIVGYSIDERMTAALAVAALRNAITTAPRSPLSSTRTEAVNFAPDDSCMRCRPTDYAARWAGLGRVVTTPRWSRSSHCCNATSSTAGTGRPARTCAWPSSPGSNGPTTADDGNADPPA